MFNRLTGSLALLVAGFALTGICSVASAQPSDRPSLEERRDRKLAEPWLKKADWTLDYDRARELAAASGKLIFAYFTRSYAP